MRIHKFPPQVQCPLYIKEGRLIKWKTILKANDEELEELNLDPEVDLREIVKQANTMFNTKITTVKLIPIIT